MMNRVNPRQITLAREARLWTQAKLSREVPSLSQGNISLVERGQLGVTDSTIQELAVALRFPVSFFYEEDVRPALSDLYYRKQYRVNGIELKYIRATVSIITRAIGHLMEDVDMDMKFLRMRFDLSGTSWNIKTAANAAREILGIPSGPIKNLISYIEKSGIIVYYTDFNIEGHDGVATFTENGWPILFIDRHKPNDRLRMTIPHEKAHTCLHIPFIVEPYRDKELEAKKYASEFLMPSHEIRKDLMNFSFNDLTSLKEYWGVAKSALIMKAFSLSLIDQRTYRYMMIELGRRGERKEETGFVDIDSPTLLQKIISLHRDTMTDEELAEMTNLTVEDFRKFFDNLNNGIRLRRLIPTI